jgi:signal transduction histidine kinase
VIQTGEHYLAPNINDDPYHLRNPNLPETRSEMVFPLVAHGQIIGAVDLQSDQEVHLLPEEVTTLQTLAGQLANAISNAQLYQQVTDNLAELTQTKIQLDMRTAVAWMGMISSVRRHSIDNHAVTILDELAMLAELLPPESLTEPVRQKLEAIRLMATKIRSKPITPPALTEERVESVAINSLLQDRLTQLLESVPQRHEGVQREFIFHLEDCRCVRASVEWLQRIFDVLIDNALEAMRDVEVRRLTITTRQSGSLVEIAISDTGTGIPDAIRPSILVSQVIKEGRSRGLGMGLLMAQMIVQNYQGEIKLAATGSEGTTFVVQLPLEL